MDRHGSILAIFTAQERYGFAVFFAPRKDSRLSCDKHVSQPAPIFFVVIDDHRNLRILENIFYPLELPGRSTLGLFINGREKFFAVEGKADGNNMGLAGDIRGCKVRDASGAEQTQALTGKA
jgi:hypothetical protein